MPVMLVADHQIDTFSAQRVSTPHPWHHEPLVSVSADPSVLLQRVQTGDRSAFSELYDALAPMVFGAVKRVLRDPAMSEEVTQEVFLEIWKTADRFDPERAKASTWAVTLARRRAVDRVRHEQSQRNRVDDLSHQPVVASVGPEDSVVSSLDTERVARALAQLPDDQREVIQLAFIDGLAHGAIAEQLDLPLGTVKGRVRGGLRRLRGLIGESP
jgi:RNA polymerase sigma-70 factor (ECF subfamily)